MKTLHDGTEVSDDTPTKNVSGLRYLLTPEEIAARQAEEAAYEAAKPLLQWQSRMAATDSKIPRYVEDLIDGVQSALQASGVSLSNHIPDALMTAYAEKKTIRSQKPKSG
jgi:hypothetical protein